MKLTPAQHRALIDLSKAPSSAYTMRVSTSTLWSLNRACLARPVGLGHMAMPRNGTWTITDAGRAALAARKEEGGE